MTNKNLKIIYEKETPLYEGIGKQIELRGKNDIPYSGTINLLSEENIDEFMNLEEKTNIPEIKASKETILYRFSKGVNFIGFRLEDKLVSTFGFRFGIFSPDNPEELPQTFDEYANPRNYNPINFNAIYAGGFNVDWGLREKGLGKLVAKQMINTILEQGKISECDYALFDPRLHTYNGCNQPPIEKFNQDPILKEIIDKAIKGEREFILNDLLRDPEFKIYYNLADKKPKFIKLMSNTWFPEDTSSGGFGVYVYVDLLI